MHSLENGQNNSVLQQVCARDMGVPCPFRFLADVRVARAGSIPYIVVRRPCRYEACLRSAGTAREFRGDWLASSSILRTV